MNIEYEFFWSGPFSQWYKDAPFTCVLGLKWNTCEQYMMAEKALLFKDMEMYQKIRSSSDPASQKAYGRAVQNYNDKEWNLQRLDSVFSANMYKFSQNQKMKKLILSTKGKILVEASPRDKIWGIGLDRYDAIRISADKWPGKNYLGKVLMLVRECLDENKMFENTIYEEFKKRGWL